MPHCINNTKNICLKLIKIKFTGNTDGRQIASKIVIGRLTDGGSIVCAVL